ncbi:acetate--CoA ligase [Poriferisphaera sp. WC338]|uniref:acetate--CoA ligase n=1 Tax=Poriferisphaera sp. WC338 TaxID=3425129 RepID=UPI003D81728A
MAQAGKSTESESSMESVLTENRHFPPPAAFAKQAHIGSIEKYEEMHKRSVEDSEGFWSEVADELHWFKKWDTVLEWNLPDAKWFVGGKTNICYNCIDRQIDDGLGDHTAIVWEGEPIQDQDGGHAGGEPEIRKLTYNDLKREVSRFANALKNLGVKKGDVVTIYMPMVPELAIAMLACARIGAPHSIIFGGFSASAIRDRVEDGKSNIVITADGGWRRGKAVPLKDNVDEALTLTDLVKTVVVLERCQNDINMVEGRDHWWEDITATASEHCEAEPMDAEDLLFILYTSGSTGKPKGIMHTTGGYMVYTYLTSKYTFDLHPENNDMYWCTADIGWITGHSYIVYGLLPNRVPTLMYEGAPDAPDKDRFWDIIERHKVTKFYTAPTAIRAFMKWGREHIDKHDLSSLNVLGTVGEPINPEAWMWYHEVIGNEKCPIVDTWWQTETGGHMLTPLPGATTTTPGSCTKPFFGIDAAVVNSEGEPVGENEGGILVIRKPWPSMLRGVYGNRERFIDTYWSKVEGYYTAGDGARKDEHGNFWIMGRIDDVIVVAGHNLGTMEVESALVSHDAVAEAAVVGFPHDIKGTGIAAFVTLVGGIEETDELKKQVRDHVAKELGPISKPDKLQFTPALPKTRSGKIMRRLLRDIAAGREISGDITTLEDKSIVEKLQQQAD